MNYIFIYFEKNYEKYFKKMMNGWKMIPNIGKWIMYHIYWCIFMDNGIMHCSINNTNCHQHCQTYQNQRLCRCMCYTRLWYHWNNRKWYANCTVFGTYPTFIPIPMQPHIIQSSYSSHTSTNTNTTSSNTKALPKLAYCICNAYINEIISMMIQ